MEWARGYIAIIEALRKYVMEHHTTGLAWNFKVIRDERLLRDIWLIHRRVLL